MTKTGFCLVVAHDAGGAEILASYVRRNQLNCGFVLEGPAVKVFQQKFITLDLLSLDEGLKQADWVLCATSWQSDLEWRATQLAKLNGIPSVTFLDHWINYSERFLRDGVMQLPDEIWVGDGYAETIAKNTFLGLLVKKIDNPYLLDVEKELRALERQQNSRVKKATLLFVSENISEHALLKFGDKKYFGYTEFDALDFLLENLNVFDGHSFEQIIIRSHPSDKKDKYKTYEKKHPNFVSISQSTSLLEDIVSADIITGCESMALIVALLTKKRVISCIPKPYKLRLPHKEILSLRDILG
jgi:hypothetical protein